MKKVTIMDIAREVNVSVSTVSNVINGKDKKVSSETIEKIRTAIKEMNYVPNQSARNLVKNKSKLIGVIIPQTEEQKQLLLENPFYSEMVSGIESKTREKGYYMILTGLDQDKSLLDIFLGWNLDGAIIMGIYQERFYEELKQIKVPITLVDSYINDSYFYNVGTDDEYGGYLGTKYLIDCGHRNIALVTGSIKKDGVTEKRFLGYKRALKEANIFYKPELVFEKAVTYEWGVESGKIIGKKISGEITAVFATADVIAAGVVSGLKACDKDVPGDFSVMGFDDIPIARMMVPQLTTIKQNICGKGSVAAQQVIDAIEGGSDEIQREILLPLTVVERSSVSKI